MKVSTIILTAAFTTTFAGAALADHNSKWGEGTGLDPLKVHDTRIDTKASGDVFTGGKLLEHPVKMEPVQRMSMPSTINVTTQAGRMK